MELDYHKDTSILADIVDTMATGLFTVDPQGRFVAWNRGAEQITGYTAAEVRGKPCSILEGPNCKGFGRIVDLIREPPDPTTGKCEQQCKIAGKGGRELHIHGHVCVLRDHAGQVTGAVGTFADITSVVVANEKLHLLESQTRPRQGLEKMVGKSAVMLEVFRRIRLAADSDVTVLLTGESGTGKELAAHAIHRLSARRDQPFLAINCSAIPDNLLESELFGHVQGAFTGAHRNKLGVFQAADHGTLFLDEIADVSPAMQVKLLRTLQEREIRRVGEERATRVNVRTIAATNKDLRAMVSRGELREDFYYRIHVFEIHLPPLRQRKEDIPDLVQRFLEQLNAEQGKHVDGIARDALQRILDYHWPGNIRELRNAMEHAMVTVSGDRISYLDLPIEVRDPQRFQQPQLPDDLTSEELAERDRIRDALRTTGGNRTQAARLLGTSRVTLWKKINRYGLS